MKIAIPVDEKSVETSVCDSFGRTPYVLFYDTESRERVYVENRASDSQGGAGVITAQLIVDNNVSALLTPRCGNNAATVIKAAGIEIYKTKHGSALENISTFIDGQLSRLEEIHAGFHHHGGK